MADLFSLPVELTCTILCEWLSVSQLGRLDSAFCSKLRRPQLHEIFQSPQFVTDEMKPANFGWLVSRNMKVGSIRSCNDTGHGDTVTVLSNNSNLLVEYLEKNAAYCRKLYLSAWTLNEVIAFLAAHCTRVEFISVNVLEFHAVVQNVAQLLKNNPNLKEVVFPRATASTNSFHTLGVVLPSVETVVV